MKLRRWGTALRALTALVLVAIILHQVDWPVLGATLSNLQPLAAAAAMASFAAVSLLEALRLLLVMRPNALTFLAALRLQVIGSAPGNVTPAQIGGDAYRIHRLNAEGLELIPTSARLATLRMLSLAIVATAATTLPLLDRTLITGALSFEPGLATGPGTYTAYAVACVGLILIVALLWRVRSRVRGLIDRLGPAIRATTVAQLLIVTALMLMLRGLCLLLLSRCVGLDVTQAQALLVTCLAILATVMPVSVAGIGIREGVIVALLTTYTGSYEGSVGVAILSRGLMIAQACLGVGWWLGERRGR
ncbi:MAG: lysylphosphatidylglycerol synthase domain-containing protein [Pseudomonadales bacterium]